MSNTYSEWNNVEWKQIERYVFKLQRRIYQASRQNDLKKVRKLQKTLVRSYRAKLLATRQVTQDNSGKKTAGIDGVKSLTPKQRLKMAAELNLKTKPLPARRIYIPKANGEKRPLSIPAMRDRAAQALVKLILEPEWEARFEPNSYGFRKGRSAHDAIEAIFISINQKAKYVLDADISKCFDTINHEYLLRKLGQSPTMNRVIKAWLKAGWVFQGKKENSEMGTPQGGIISPLLANVALHGMEERLNQFADTLKGRKRGNRAALTLVRYADDFIVLHPSLEIITQCQTILSDWLKEVGLEISKAKTHITHTSEGFDFLGFNIRQYKVGKHASSKNTNGTPLGFKTLIKPSKKSIIKHYRNLAKTVEGHNAAPQVALIAKLNPIIRGWGNYYSTVVSKETFQKLDKLLWERLERWSKRRHPNKSKTWCNNKYFKTVIKIDPITGLVKSRNWVFKDDQGTLCNHADTKIIRHTKVAGTTSPFEGNLGYWGNRIGSHPEIPTRVSKLLKRQKNKCNHCGLTFRDGDKWEVDHVIPTTLGGKDGYNNLQLLHRHCHDVKSSKDGSSNRK